MPNWVYSTMTVSGEKEQVSKFTEQAEMPGLFTTEGQSISKLSFANFVRPDASIMDEYWGEEPRKASLEEAMRFESNHWYDWNIRNWGCKWDANDAYADTNTDGTEAQYEYNTAWSPAIKVFYAMVQQFPELSFGLRYAEEQGWGGELRGEGGTHWIVDEWDIPSTHKERMEHFGYCQCEEMRPDEMEWAYKDCPKKKELSLAGN